MIASLFRDKARTADVAVGRRPGRAIPARKQPKQIMFCTCIGRIRGTYDQRA